MLVVRRGRPESSGFSRVELFSMTRKLPSARQPFDPGRAARERAEAAAAANAPRVTTPTRTVRKAGLRPLPPVRSGSDE